ncbi:MAG: RsmE family RNA methyltransferase [Leptospirillia bacterium]
MTERGREEVRERGRSSGPVLFWLTPSDLVKSTPEGAVLYPGETLSHHLFRSLRARVGDRFLFVDPDQPQRRLWGRVSKEAPPELSLSEVTEGISSPRRIFDLAVALLKGEAWEELLEPAAILGARRLVPLLADRSQLRWSSTVLAKKRERFMAKVREASQLAGRADRMEIAEPISLAGLLSELSPDVTLLFCDTKAPAESAGTVMAGLGGSPAVAAIGPEGGWSERERALVKEFAQKGRRLCRLSLGPLILPGRLAPVVVASLLSQEAARTEHQQGEGSS